MIWIIVCLVVIANVFIIVECINAPVYDDNGHPIIELNIGSYELGQLAGEIIEMKYLPTLETDMLKTFNVVKVDDDELIENKRLNDILDDSYSFNGGSGDSATAHKDWIDHVYILAEKHLPEKLECKINKVNPKNMDSFKDGLKNYLWNTDLSWYMPEDDFFKPNHKLAWCSTIVLTRTKQ